MEREEAIEVIKKNWPDSSFTMLREALETLIPELKESDDERIRKWIMDELKDSLNSIRSLYSGDYDGRDKDYKPESSEAVAVDLGLPSGTLWADRNVGADSPSDFGLYFSWGNLIGNIIGSECNFYDDEYNKTPGRELDGDIDIEHDVARCSMGEPWEIPTKDQFTELVDNCTTEWCHENGHVGMRFTSKINGNSVFFPAAGYGYGMSIGNVGALGRYWSSSWYSAGRAYYMAFYSSTVLPQDLNYRYLGFSVRAVQNSPTK